MRERVEGANLSIGAFHPCYLGGHRAELIRIGDRMMMKVDLRDVDVFIVRTGSTRAARRVLPFWLPGHASTAAWPTAFAPTGSAGGRSRLIVELAVLIQRTEQFDIARTDDVLRQPIAHHLHRALREALRM